MLLGRSSGIRDHTILQPSFDAILNSIERRSQSPGQLATSSHERTQISEARTAPNRATLPINRKLKKPWNSLHFIVSDTGYESKFKVSRRYAIPTTSQVAQYSITTHRLHSPRGALEPLLRSMRIIGSCPDQICHIISTLIEWVAMFQSTSTCVVSGDCS